MSNRYSFIQKEIICSLDINDGELSFGAIKNPKERRLITNNPHLLHKTIAAKKFFQNKKIDESAEGEEAAQLAHMFGGKEELRKSARIYEKIVQDLEEKQKIIHLAKEWQKQIAAEVAHELRHDVRNVAYDPNKIRKYEKLAGIVENDETPSIKSEKIYTLLSWFTSIRLFFVRLNRVLGSYGLGFLPNLFSLFGLSYAFEIIADISVIAWSTFRPLRQEEIDLMQKENISKGKIFWWRFVNVVTKDERIPRMLNAMVWLAINLTCIILTGGLSASIVAPIVTLLVNKLNIGGYVFDVVNEIGKGIRDFFRHRNTLKKVNNEITELENQKQELNNELQKLYSLENKRTLNHAEKLRCKVIENRIQELTLQIKSRELIKSKLDTKINYSLITSRVYNVLSVTMLFVGMALVFFPPTTAVGACLFAGGLLALIGGSVLGGFGKRVWNKLCQATSSPTNKDKDKTSYGTHCKMLFNNECDLQFIKNNTPLPKKSPIVTENILLKKAEKQQKSGVSFFSRLFKRSNPAPMPSTKVKLAI